MNINQAALQQQKDNSTVIPILNSSTGVPLDKILSWAGLIFRATGIMPDPIEVLARMGLEAAMTGQGQPPTAQQGITDQPPFLPPITPGPTSPTPPAFAQPGEGSGGYQQHAVALQYPFPQTLGVQPEQGTEVDLKRKTRRNHIDYSKTPYFTEAESLILASSRPELASRFHSVLVLGFILAWCNFPLFKSMSGRTGEFMALSALKASRELGIGLNQFRTAIAALQGARLIEVGLVQTQVIPRARFDQLQYDVQILDENLGGGSFWQPRSIQENTFFYKLKAKPSDLMPTFNPFKEGQDHLGSLSNTLESHKSASEQGRNHIRSLDNTSGSLEIAQIPLEITSKADLSDPGEPSASSCINVINDHDDDGNAPKISDKENSIKAIPGLEVLINRLGQEKRAKYDFLTKEASFEDFTTEDNQSTLDPSEAYKFAIRERLTLSKIKERHAQVSEMWLAGQVRKSPLALLHYSLKRDKDPRGFGLEALEAQLQRQADAEDARAATTEGNDENGNRPGKPDRRPNLAANGNRAQGAPQRNSGGFGRGKLGRSGHVILPDGTTSRFGNADCTDLEDGWGNPKKPNSKPPL